MAGALAAGSDEASGVALERAFAEFPGPLLRNEPSAPWFTPAAERVRGAFVELAVRLGMRFEQRGDRLKACDVYQRALDAYPTSERMYEALLRVRLAMGDVAGALEDYHRCERILASTLNDKPSPSLRRSSRRSLPQP